MFPLLSETLEKLLPVLDVMGVLRNGQMPLRQVSTSVGSACSAPVLSLHEEDLVKIFSFLSLSDVLHVSRVCRWWYKLSFACILWKDVDMKHFAPRLTDPVKLELLIYRRFSTNIQCLDLSGFIISVKTLQILSSSCKRLRNLTLASVTFTSDANRAIHLDNLEGRGFFPAYLEYLDIRFSQGNSQVYRTIASSLSNIKWLRLCDAFLYTLLRDGSLETTIKSMKQLRKLELSHCLLLKDNILALFARCSKLELLSVRKCIMLTGTFVQDFLQSCVHLNTVIMDGVSIFDDTLKSTRWDNSRLTHLELGWCPLITPRGLKSALSRITKIQNLEYLGLCSVGDGRALNDQLLSQLAASLSRRPDKKLKWLNLNCSRCITTNGVDGLRPFVETLDTINCSAVNSSVTNTISGKTYDENGIFHYLSDARKARKKPVLSSRNAFGFKWALETPL